MKTSIFALVAASLIAGPALAAKNRDRDRSDTNREEGIGIGAGGIIGAIAGGPIGFIIGAATGGWVGNKIDKLDDDRDAFEERYQRAEQIASTLESELGTAEAELSEMRVVMREQDETYREKLHEALDVEVYFRTGEAALSDQVADRVERLGELVGDFEDFVIVVEGHADVRGDATYNDQLSAQRAAAVREALIRAGLPSERIMTKASGENASRAAEGDLDAMALDRRVELSVAYPVPRENRVAQQ